MTRDSRYSHEYERFGRWPGRAGPYPEAHPMGVFPWSGGPTRYDFGPPPGPHRYPPDHDRPARTFYDRGFKSSWQTEHGDPFGDRARGTPIRVVRGDYRAQSRRRPGSAEYGRWGYGRPDRASGYDHEWMW